LCITGASKGIGRGIALKLVAGYTLVLNYSFNDADVGNAVAYLLAAEAHFVSGHHLLVNSSADL
jgi:NAD(P)-dependent dehydrogenase (short-subunit alcohol dehydrogenase family)